ncbi:MAG: valine--tRNA ligase [Planctomycetes bacterium]|nr:valine--tRNA ligase [Planctomycetota bacterium]
MSTIERELPKQYDHAAAQERWYAFWEEQGYFHSEPDPERKRFPKGPFTIVIPPPNVTGALHLGHALNNTLQDICIRSKRMQGFNALWMPGTDHAGIATQAVVERRLLEEQKLSRHDLGREKLVERIWAWKEQYEKRIIGQLKQMGCSCDWQRTRFTLDDVCAKAVRQTFFEMFKRGLIYRGKRLVNWDTFLQTAVSDDEVFHETVKGHFWYFRYPVIDPNPGEPTHVLIATTRPETMLGDTAVAVHPDPAAALDGAEKELKERLAAAPEKEKVDLQKQIDDIQERRRTLLPELVKLRDMAVAGRQVMLPLLNRPIPLVADEWAKPELGTGCVKITPAHDANDYEVGKRRELPMVNILNPDGTLNESGGPYAKLTMRDARKRVVADMEAAELVDRIEDREIDLAHSDRSKTTIEPYLADQWFVKMDQLAQSAMDAVTEGQVRITPERYAKSYLDWLGEKRDWPVSRQLWWGHRIPVWRYVGKLGVPIDNAFGEGFQTLFSWIAGGRIAAVFAGSSVEPDERWGITMRSLPDYPDSEYDLLICLRNESDEDVIQALECVGFVRDPDVLDTWFSSALWPHSTLGWPEKTPELAYYYPTSVLITSRDIITLWVARMVLTGLFNVGDVPFHEVYIHPKILDGYGETMSKSKGNGVDPLDVVEKFGADSLRFGLAYMATETQDVRMPVEFECPHCQETFEQTKKNRVLPVVECPKCHERFSTQWASTPEDQALPRGAVVSERFELGRNFCNKLWNVSKLVITNLEGYTPGAVADKDLALEDRWLLSRLATVTDEVTKALETYRFADAARALYDFTWSEFCSYYAEMVKPRLSEDAQRLTAQRVFVHTLDAILRLLHPMIPFITEEVWQLLNEVAPTRGLPVSGRALAPGDSARRTIGNPPGASAHPLTSAPSIMIAPWPEANLQQQDPTIEARFARFQAVLGGLREIRSRQNIAPKAKMEFVGKCDAATADLLKPMAPYFASMAGATATAWGPDVSPPAVTAHTTLPGIELYVDLTGLIDVEAEKARGEKEETRLTQLIAAKQQKLSNESFVSRAPADVVAKERAALAELEEQLRSVRGTLGALRR